MQAKITMETNANRDKGISMKEILKAFKCIKLGKAEGWKYSRQSSIPPLIFLLDQRRRPEDWCKTITVPLYKGNRSKQDCKNTAELAYSSLSANCMKRY